MAAVNRLPAQLNPIDARRPSPALMNEIISWLSSNFDLPAIYDYPHIEFASAARLALISYKGLLGRSVRDISLEYPEAVATQPQDIVALYHDASKTIFLTDNWTGTTPVDISVLVHEMVHHLQNLGNLVHECPPAREKLAYRAQEAWLKKFGQDLKGAFEVDMLTILVRSVCTY
jgi:hypothetical protein